jgi:hypothetical protein
MFIYINPVLIVHILVSDGVGSDQPERATGGLKLLCR